MIIKKGLGVSNGYKIAKAFVVKNFDFTIEHKHIDDTQHEIEKVDKAFKKTESQIEKIKELALSKIGEENAMVFDAHLEILNDPTLKSKVEYYVNEEKREASWAVATSRDEIVKIFESIDDEYMRARAVDVKDICDRIIRNIKGIKDTNFSFIKEDSVVIAHDLTPSETAKIGSLPVVGFATEIGGKTSHAAIMASAMNIPAVVALGDGFIDEVNDGDLILIDGKDGEVIVNPDNETLQNFEKKMDLYIKEEERLRQFVNKLGATKDGKRVVIEGYIGTSNDVKKVLDFGGEAIGLFRSEFLFMDRQTLPTEEEQFIAYADVMKRMDDKPVVIRTLDIGGDKNVPAMNLPKEANPFLGYRAIRICLRRKSFFKVQIRALLRASHFGNLKVMFPMISSIEEVVAAKKMFEEAKEELRNEKVPFDEKLKIGVMIEIPAAAINAKAIAKYVDFFSIGTNDLIQYSCAVDRLNEKVSYLYQPLHPSVLRLIKMVGDAAKEQNIECGVCGEMGGMLGVSPILVGLGVTNLTMSAPKILRTKEMLSKFTYDECKEIANCMINNETTEQNLAYFDKALRPYI